MIIHIFNELWGWVKSSCKLLEINDLAIKQSEHLIQFKLTVEIVKIAIHQRISTSWYSGNKESPWYMYWYAIKEINKLKSEKWNLDCKEYVVTVLNMALNKWNLSLKDLRISLKVQLGINSHFLSMNCSFNTEIIKLFFWMDLKNIWH